jgi:protein-S-isoprenylcysteine O-methyltransferase Ste14
MAFPHTSVTGEETPLAERDGGGSSGVRFPPPSAYAAGFLVGLAVEAAIPLPGPPSAVAISAGVIGVALWLGLDAWAMLKLRRASTAIAPTAATTALVTSGPYRVTRNPMYLGMAFMYAGLALAFGVTWALVLLPVVLIVVDRLVVTREERYLETSFGDDYRAYTRRVRRWL